MLACALGASALLAGCTRKALAPARAPSGEAELVRRALAIVAWAPGVSYAVGDLATYQGVTFRCRQAHTSQPGQEPPRVPALWERPGAAGVAPWANQTAYVVGSGVSFDGLVYRCLQAHTSQPDWTPPATPALWRVTGNVLIPPGVSGSLVFVFKAKKLPGGIRDGFGLIQRDPFGDATFSELLDTNARSVGEVFYRVRVQGGEIFELYLQANKTRASSSPSMSPATYSSDPTMNRGIDPTFPDHVAQPLQTPAQKASHTWSLRWESFKFGDAGRDGKFDDVIVEVKVVKACVDTNPPAPIPTWWCRPTTPPGPTTGATSRSRSPARCGASPPAP